MAELRPIPPRRFVPRADIADAARRAPRVDAARLRADLDAVVDQSTDGCDGVALATPPAD